VYDVQDWAEVRRLRREGWTNTAIAEKLLMSRNTVASLIAKQQPPRYERESAGSMLDSHVDAMAAMLHEDPKAPATVIRERLQALGYTGGITILKERLAELRPNFLAARCYQRTSYLPGELAQLDWWETGVEIPVGKGATRKAFGLLLAGRRRGGFAGSRLSPRSSPRKGDVVTLSAPRRMNGSKRKADERRHHQRGAMPATSFGLWVSRLDGGTGCCWWRRVS
jgi:hypothetical protein